MRVLEIISTISSHFTLWEFYPTLSLFGFMNSSPTQGNRVQKFQR